MHNLTIYVKLAIRNISAPPTFYTTQTKHTKYLHGYKLCRVLPGRGWWSLILSVQYFTFKTLQLLLFFVLEIKHHCLGRQRSNFNNKKTHTHSTKPRKYLLLNHCNVFVVLTFFSKWRLSIEAILTIQNLCKKLKRKGHISQMKEIYSLIS